MTCREFQEVLPDVVEGVRSIDQESHLKTCPGCLGLVADLETIFREARQLEGLYEPSPRVWNAIESKLRQEGIIQGAHIRPALVSSFRKRWFSPWIMAPVAAMAMIALMFVYQRPQTSEVASQVEAVPAPVVVAKHYVPNPDDQRLLKQAKFSSPVVRQTYEANLRDVNAYIQDAEESAREHPNDEETQLSLMNAYEQRSMVYEMAMDRSLP